MRRCLQHCQPPVCDLLDGWSKAHLASCKHHTGEEEEKEEKEEREGREKEEREGKEKKKRKRKEERGRGGSLMDWYTWLGHEKI